MVNQLINESSQISAVISLYKGLAGGWLDTPVQELITEDVRNTMQERSDWGDLLTAPLPATSIHPPSTPEALPHE